MTFTSSRYQRSVWVFPVTFKLLSYHYFPLRVNIFLIGESQPNDFRKNRVDNKITTICRTIHIRAIVSVPGLSISELNFFSAEIELSRFLYKKNVLVAIVDFLKFILDIIDRPQREHNLNLSHSLLLSSFRWSLQTFELPEERNMFIRRQLYGRLRIPKGAEKEWVRHKFFKCIFPTFAYSYFPWPLTVM